MKETLSTGGHAAFPLSEVHEMLGIPMPEHLNWMR